MDSRRFDEAVATRRALLLGLGALAAMPLLGCSSGSSDLPALLMADGVQRRMPPADAPVGAAAQGMTAFGHRLFEAAAQPGANFVISPLSLAVAFAMLRAGASGATAKELDIVFGFPAAGRDAAFNAMTRQLVTADVPPQPNRKPREPGEPPRPPVVTIGNALFPQKDFAIGQEFLRTLAAEYGAGVRPVDFSAGAVKAINAWADKQTAGRIKEVFRELSAQTKLVLANAVYFKADWTTPFLLVSPATFTKADGKAIETPTMMQSGTVRYAEVNGVKAIELPYASGPYAMWLMLPPPGGKPEDTLRPATVAQIRAGFTSAQVEMAIPKWDFKTSLDLAGQLPPLGMPTVFGDGADFSLIAPGLLIDQAVHQANITVDEWGSEAAAITSISMATSAPPPPTIRFIADRPFAFAIVGGKEQTPLFIGRVSDPSSK